MVLPFFSYSLHQMCKMVVTIQHASQRKISHSLFVLVHSSFLSTMELHNKYFQTGDGRLPTMLTRDYIVLLADGTVLHILGIGWENIIMHRYQTHIYGVLHIPCLTVSLLLTVSMLKTGVVSNKQKKWSSFSSSQTLLSHLFQTLK